MKEKVQAPQLRFDGFTDDWEERKLKELGDIQTGNTPPTSDSDNYSLDGVLWVTPTDIKSLVISNTAKKLSQVGVTKARIAKAGSILVTSIASIGKNTLLRMDAGFNQQINSLTPTSENDSYFLLTQSEKWSEKMKQTAASATMQIVNKTDFSNISTYVPIHKEEQEKIGSFFKQLDNTIALHQHKLDLLKEQKKGFLQKMFPKNGAKVPELRFAGFADDWEQRKLGEMLEDKTILEQSDGNHGELYPKSSEFAKEGIPYLAASNIIDNNIDYQNVKYLPLLRAEQFKKGVARDGDILLAHNATVGPSALLKINLPFVILSTTLTLYRINKDKMDNLFFLSIIRSNKVQNQLKKMMKQTTRNQVPILAQRTIDIFYPKNLKEQAKVGEFFKQLDDTIALHQRKLDLLKEQKKGFLQKMFV
ncbi:RNA polymerase sigma factor RpoD, rpoD [Lactococcus lactis subsp. lactis]|nr:RNA polymerase sigma factor RpoD, rpoD [Lactococcus lactis subsp. lactis]